MPDFVTAATGRLLALARRLTPTATSSFSRTVHYQRATVTCPRLLRFRALFLLPSLDAAATIVSSHVCINGYRWITRDLDRWDNPAQNAIPVRC